MPVDGQVARSGLRPGERVVAVAGRLVDSADGVVDAIGSGGSAVEGHFHRHHRGRGRSPHDHQVDLGSAIDTTAPTAFRGSARTDHRHRRPPDPVASSVTEFGRYVGATVAGTGRALWTPNIVGFLADTATGSEPLRHGLDADPGRIESRSRRPSGRCPSSASSCSVRR